MTGSRLEGGSLVIGSVSKSDHGQYQCKAENVAGVRESPSVTLGVHQPPHFIKKPQAVTVALVGGDLVLECEAVGDPQPRLSWTRAQGHINTDKLRSDFLPSVSFLLSLLFCLLHLFVDVPLANGPTVQDDVRRGPRPPEHPPQRGGRLPVPR